MQNLARVPIVAALALILLGCERPAPPAAARVVNLYIWSNYLGPHTLEAFTARTGIKVNVSYFDSDETLEGRMLTGHSGFDVVVPNANFIGRQIRSGAYLALDKTKLPNLHHLDPKLMARIAANDPGNLYAVDYTYGTVGIGYNATQVRDLLPEEAFNSWRALFDPEQIARLAGCGVGMIDSPAELMRVALLYLHRSVEAPTAQDVAAAASALGRIRPYVHLIASDMVEPFANREVCVVLSYNGGIIQSRNHARDAKNGAVIKFVIPQEGALLWADLLAIPRDAAHVEEAHTLINYLLEPEVIAGVTNQTGYATGNLASRAFVDPRVLYDTASYPADRDLPRLFLEGEDSPEQTRRYTRIWQRFKTGE
jgi:putrescine transport system substrate-binding protein